MLMDCIKTYQMSKRAKDNYNAQFFGNDDEVEVLEDEKTYCEACSENDAEIVETSVSKINGKLYEENLCFCCRNKAIKRDFKSVKDYRKHYQIVLIKLFK